MKKLLILTMLISQSLYANIGNTTKKQFMSQAVDNAIFESSIKDQLFLVEGNVEIPTANGGTKTCKFTAADHPELVPVNLRHYITRDSSFSPTCSEKALLEAGLKSVDHIDFLNHTPFENPKVANPILAVIVVGLCGMAAKSGYEIVEENYREAAEAETVAVGGSALLGWLASSVGDKILPQLAIINVVCLAGSASITYVYKKGSEIYQSTQGN